MRTIINNDNIKRFINIYVRNQPLIYSLPIDLQHIPINEWDVSRVTNMTLLFSDVPSFNEPLNKWIVSNVRTMSHMFMGCRVFNQPLNNWNVSNVKDMSSMFSGCRSFNQSLDKWNVSNVKLSSYMFQDCNAFNKSLNTWNVSNVRDMGGMFSGCSVFNESLSNWNIGKVKDMIAMFRDCLHYNQNLNNWNVYAIATRRMFDNCPIDEENKPSSFPPIVAPSEGDMLQIEPQMDISNTEDIYDILMASNIPANELSTYLQDPTTDYILFKHENKLFLTTADGIDRALDKTDISNSLVLICLQEWPARLNITAPDLRDETIYVNLSKLGLYGGGYALESQIKAALNYHRLNPGKPLVYTLTMDPAIPRAPSVISWSLYKRLTLNAVSASHCQPGRDGDIYRITISRYTILPPPPPPPPNQALGRYKKKRIHKKTIKPRKTRKSKKSRKPRKSRKTRK